MDHKSMKFRYILFIEIFTEGIDVDIYPLPPDWNETREPEL